MRSLLLDIASFVLFRCAEMSICTNTRRGLTEKQVNNASDVLKLMQKAQDQRVVGETKMNKASSRSHCLFTIQIAGKIRLVDGDGDMAFTGKLHMVDLAGSECAKSAGNDKSCPDSAAREMERRNINKSLLTLGRVITILKEKSQGKTATARVPYRCVKIFDLLVGFILGFHLNAVSCYYYSDSKLTRILQESLGGRCKTVVVATLSPSITAIEESISTLNYAQSANGIINKPVSSSLISFGENQFSDKTPEDGTTVESWQEMEMRLQYMQTQIDEAQAALARKHLQQLELQERADRAEAKLLENKQKLYNAEMEIKSLKVAVESETKKRKMTEVELHRTEINLRKTSLILQATQTTETSLTSEALTIIGTLEKVIRERNELHSLMTSQFHREAGKKAATKEFQVNTLDLLRNIESSLMVLCKHIESKQQDGVDAANLTHEVGQQFVTETQNLVNEIASNVSSATTLMRAQLMGEKGIAACVDASAAAVTSNVQGTNEIFSQAGEALAESCKTIKSNFNDCTKLLNGKAAEIESSTNQTLQDFESKITESRESMLSLLMKLKSSLSKLSNAKTEKANALNELVDEWKKQSLGKSQSIMDVTSTNLESLKASAAHFEEELQHHDAVSKALHGQKNFIDEYVAGHVNSISAQNTSLLAHRNMISQYHDTQTTLCNQVMKSIMSSVQNVVKSELGKLSVSQKNHLQALHKDGAKLAETNQRIKQSAEQVMTNFRSTNTALSDAASIMRANDLKASEQMQSTQEALEQISSFSTSHHQLISDYAGKNVALIQDMRHLDSQNAEIADMVQRDINSCSESLVDAVLKPTVAAMKKTTQASLEIMSHVDKAVLQTANTALDDVAAKQKVAVTQVNDKLHAVQEEMSRLKKNVVGIAESQNTTAVNLNNGVSKSCTTMKKTSAPCFVAELNANREKLITTITEMSKSTVSAISEYTTQNDVMKESIQDFALNKMQCHKPTSSVPAMKDCKYSTELSSTPAEEVIFKNHNFNPVEKSHADDASNEASDGGDTSQDTNDDDNRSIMSSGSVSMSIPSPRRLQSRDLNANQATLSNIRRSRSHSRPTSSTVTAAGISKKNKLPSRLRTPSESRKKMRM